MKDIVFWRSRTTIQILLAFYKRKNTTDKIGCPDVVVWWGGLSMSVQLFGISQFVLTNIATHRIYHVSKEFLLVQNCLQDYKWPFHMSLFWFKTVRAKRSTHPKWYAYLKLRLCFFYSRSIKIYLYFRPQKWHVLLIGLKNWLFWRDNHKKYHLFYEYRRYLKFRIQYSRLFDT